MFRKELIEETLRHLNSLASVCDNAMTEDGVGFSKSDLIGHYIVEMPEYHIDEDWMIVSLQLVVKYQNQLGIDPQIFKDALKQYDQKQLSLVKQARKSRVKRRIRLLDNGDFEIYFPTKQSMKGFPKQLIKTEDWITEEEIPHGYAFVVDKNAREFVQRTKDKFTEWYILDDAVESIAIAPDENSIDISNAVEYELYIKGDSIDQALDFEFKYNPEILERVKAFRERMYNPRNHRWTVYIKEPSEIDMLKAILAEFDCHASAKLLKELNSSEIKKEKLEELLEKAKAKRLEEECLNRPRAVVKQNGDHFEISFTKFNYDFVNWINANLKEKSFQSDQNAYWKVLSTPENIVQLGTKISDEDWIFSDNLDKKLSKDVKENENKIRLKELNKQISLALSKAEEASSSFSPDLSMINGTLLAFQFVVLEYGSLHENMLIGDDMGLGKSLSALACAALFGLHDSVNITCPAIARLTWRDEINKWLPNATVYIAKQANSKKNAEKEKKEILAADFVICSYNKVKIYEDVLCKRKAKLFIGDESQYLKTPKSQRTKASSAIAETCGRVYLLSGTPLTNRPKELISQLSMLRVLDTEFNGEKNFLFRYCGATHNGYGWNFDGASELTELRQRLRETCMVRRKKDDVMKFLPKKRRIRVPVDISNKAEYQKCNDNFSYGIIERLKIKAKEEIERNKIKKKEQKKYIEYFIKDGLEQAIKGEMFAHINVLRNVVGQGLIEPSIEWIDSYREGNKPLVVFAYHKEVQNALYRHYRDNTDVRVGKILASDSDDAKKQTERDFQDGKLDLLICSQMGANTNITLTASTTVLSLEYTWTPGNHIQAEDRCRRIGTSEDAESIDCYYLHAVETVDDDFWDVLTSKFEIIENTLDTDEAEDFENVDDDVKKVIFNSMFSKLMENDLIKEYA